MTKVRKFLFCLICGVPLTEIPIKTAFCSPEHRQEYRKKYRQEYWKANKEKLRKQMYEWRAKNPDKVREINRRSQTNYLARKRGGSLPPSS